MPRMRLKPLFFNRIRIQRIKRPLKQRVLEFRLSLGIQGGVSRRVGYAHPAHDTRNPHMGRNVRNRANQGCGQPRLFKFL